MTQTSSDRTGRPPVDEEQIPWSGPPQSRWPFPVKRVHRFVRGLADEDAREGIHMMSRFFDGDLFPTLGPASAALFPLSNENVWNMITSSMERLKKTDDPRQSPPVQKSGYHTGPRELPVIAVSTISGLDPTDPGT